MRILDIARRRNEGRVNCGLEPQGKDIDDVATIEQRREFRAGHDSFWQVVQGV
jgi:hypothetical protein